MRQIEQVWSLLVRWSSTANGVPYLHKTLSLAKEHIQSRYRLPLGEAAMESEHPCIFLLWGCQECRALIDLHSHHFSALCLQQALCLLWAIWRVRQCLLLGQRTGLLITCYKRNGFPKLSVPRLRQEPLHVGIHLGPSACLLPVVFGGLRRTSTEMRHALLAIPWVIKAFVSDPGVSYFLPTSSKQGYVY